MAQEPKTILCAQQIRGTLINNMVKIPLGMKGSKLISDMLTDIKVSYFDRQRQYVLLNNYLQIIWLLGRRIDDRYKITSSTKTVLKIKLL